MNTPRIEWIDECPSTNTMLAQRTDAPVGTVLAAVAQTAGRGQRGNSWEAEPGRNLTFSMLLKPQGISASRQFEMSMLVSLAIVETLDRMVDNVAIKWPNDIYVGDRKLVGILIENTLQGSEIERSIVGIGINVNQEKFLSDAPNPVSLKQITGRETPLEPLLEDICSAIAFRIDNYDPTTANCLTESYMARLWRRPGLFPYIDAASGETFMAEIEHVAPTGHLTLRTASGPRRYAFKEVAFKL